MVATGTVLQNRYQIELLLGQGGMGAVYRARHLGWIGIDLLVLWLCIGTLLPLLSNT